MGHSLCLQALPEASRLYTGLASGEQVGTLFARLFNCGGGPFTRTRLPDLGELLDAIAELEVFESRAAVDRALADLLAALEEARAEHPGLDGRRVFLDETPGRRCEEAGPGTPPPGAG